MLESITPSSTHQNAADESLNERVQRYVGLGEGSTPMGDDYIVGQLAPLWATRSILPSSARQIEGLRALLRWEELLTQTTLPSAQMLLSAANGQFAVPTLSVIRALPGDSESAAVSAAGLLAAQGATSGLATLHGLFNALLNLPIT